MSEYDWGSGVRGTLIRKTFHRWLVPTGTTYSVPGGGQVVDGSGALVSETDYILDETAIIPTSNVVGHDPAYGSSFQAGRGNPTTIIHCIINAGTCAGNSPTSTYTYDDTGQVLTSKDPCGNATCADMTGVTHTTTYSYADNFDSPPSGNTNAYLTQITDPLGHVSKFKYSYSDGQLIQSQDQNDINASRAGTAYIYNDLLRRLTEADFADGGRKTVAYDDGPYNPSTSSPSVTTTTAIATGVDLVTTTAFDGIGHPVKSNRVRSRGN